MIDAAIQSLKPDYISIKSRTPVIGVFAPPIPGHRRYLVECGDAWDWEGMEEWKWMWVDKNKKAVPPEHDAFFRTTRSLVLHDGFRVKKKFPVVGEMMDSLFYGFRGHQFWFLRRQTKSYHKPDAL
jgi:hypothetical protein